MKKIIALVLLFGFSSVAQAEEETWITKYNVKPILKTFMQYSLDLDDSAHQRRTASKGDNAFDITRLYFGMGADLSEHIGTEWKFDINAKTASGTSDDSFDIFLKTAFIEFKNFEAAPGLKFVVGQSELPWVGHQEGIWGYRMQGPMMTDYERYLTTTDLGVNALYQFPNQWGDLHLALVNGTGYNNGPELDNYKDIHLRATLRPLADKNYFISTLGVIGFNGSKSSDHERLAAMLGYKDKTHGTLAGEVFYGQDPATDLVGTHPSLATVTGNAKALGFSGFGELKMFFMDDFWKKFSVIGRLDYLDPDYATGDNYHVHVIEGLAYQASEHFKVLANHDWSSYMSGSGGQQGNNTLFLQIEAKL